MKTNAIKLSLPQLVGRGYATFWNFKGRYRVCKGSRASKKSKTTALWYITNMMKYPDANLLVIRKTYRTLKDSCFTEYTHNNYQGDKNKELPLQERYLIIPKFYYQMKRHLHLILKQQNLF